MAKALSNDLRKRVIEAYEATSNILIVCKQFSISQRTLYRWIARKKKLGTIEATEQRHVGHSHKLQPEEYGAFTLFLDNNIGLDLTQLAEKWGHGMTPKSMGRWIKKFGYTRKKNNFYTKNEAKKSEKLFLQN